MSEKSVAAWRLFVARADSLGGRAIRRALTRDGALYQRWEWREAWLGSNREEGRPLGLFVPLLELGRGEAEDTALLQEAAAYLEEARQARFTRAVLMLPRPHRGAIALSLRAAQAGLPCAAAAADPGELYGGELEGEMAGPVEALLDKLRQAAGAGAKQVSLPCREDAPCRLTSVDDLATAVFYVLCRDGDNQPLHLPGESFSYGELAGLAARAAGFGGRLRFGRKRWSKLTEEGQEVPRLPLRLLEMNRIKLYGILYALNDARARGRRLQLSACVIMKDNEGDIGRCLASLSAADEIVVVDTGSKDRSVEIAGQYTDKIYHYEWQDDFAAARNYALSLAKGDWIVFPDSDESFSAEAAPGLKDLCEDYTGPGGPQGLYARYINIELDGSPQGSEGAVTRFFRRGQHYVGAVHETLHDEKTGEPCGTSTPPPERTLMYHTGYARERSLAKHLRNKRLLEQALAKGEKGDFFWYYKARMCWHESRWEEAREAGRESALHGTVPGSLRFESYRVWYRSCLQLGDEAGLKEAREAMRRDMPTMPDSWALEGVEHWNKGEEAEGEPLLLKALELSHDFLRQNPNERNDIAKDAAGIAKELIRYYEERGEGEKAAYCRSLLEPGAGA